MHNNPNPEQVKVNDMQNLVKFHQFVHKLLRGYEILTIAKGHNSCKFVKINVL